MARDNEETIRVGDRKPTIQTVSWNARSLREKVAELNALIDKLQAPEIICIQESHLLKDNKLRIRNYVEHRQGVEQKNSPGLSILIREDLNYLPVRSTTGPFLNYQSVEVYVGRTKFLLTNSYLRSNPKHHLHEDELRTMLERPNHILVGDLNAHSPAWGNGKSDWAGQTIEKLTLDLGCMIENTGEPTRLATTANQKHTAIDLTITSDDFTYPVVQREVFEDSLESDHLPCISTLILGSNNKVETHHPSLMFNTKKAEWAKFQKLLNDVGPTKAIRNHQHCENVLREIKSAALEAIPHNQHQRRNKKNNIKYSQTTNKYWWDETCQTAVNKRKIALKELTKNNTQENITNFRIKKK
ncbi:RNA-directed DNA polymerase from mobile element jockey [Plakobranchus ocellatus]|uniref:RNA-directed DNA polymerase from mobile element jockey n=1 Tax=Plakobranchus ocellatus TaxID=259542 RepID=A0AAV4CVC6_9GAST|nr:RNA-directed DNA polymerase from mobile element jockey [Plakobranchus ocellatus]